MCEDAERLFRRRDRKIIKQLLIMLMTIFSITNLFGRDTILVKEGKKKYMYRGEREWLFKDNLPDGHYRSYEFEKENIAVEVTFKNRKKEGIENRYFSFSEDKYATVSWKNGKKNGLEVHYNGNQTINYLLTFKDNILDGYFVVNWADGEKNYTGFYKNGFRDSTWTYYEIGDNYKDTSDYWISRQFQYKNGKPYLISAWNKQGLQTIANGNGTFTDSSYYKTITSYQNGMKNGKQITIRPDGSVCNEQIYKDDLLINETVFFDNNQVAFISAWSYPLPVEIDTSKAWIDTHITDIFYNAIYYRYTPVRNGYWIEYYPNRTKVYEGDYIDGERIGVWKWNYPNGKPRIIADFFEDAWQHFDTTGNIISNLNNEFFTSLTNGLWYLNEKLSASTVVFTKFRIQEDDMLIAFHNDGRFGTNPFFVGIPGFSGTYDLLADILTITVPNEEANKSEIYKFKITSATNEKIILHQIINEPLIIGL